jgi:hypothetical protein
MEEEKKENINEYFDILINELEDNKTLYFEIPELNLTINIENKSDSIYLSISTENYSMALLSACTPIYHEIVNSKYKKGELKMCLQYLSNLFREDGSIKYSKLTDTLFQDDDILDHFNKIEIAKLTITKQKDNFTCSVCKDLNKIFTGCGHNLCRYCYIKMFKNNKCCENNCTPVLCPICRKSLNE